MIKRLFIVLLLGLLLASCAPTQKILIHNNKNYAIKEQMVELDYNKMSVKIDKASEAYIVKDVKGNTLSSQFTYDNKLIFQVDIEAEASNEYDISRGEKEVYEAKVFGRHFPERRDDFAWENDKLGFRFYGKALKAVQAPTNGLDLWYKRTERMVLEDWYKNDISGKASYHVDHGEGCDPYAVGPTLGGGAMAPFVNDSLLRNENYDSHEILDNGPLRITAKLIYPKLKIDGEEVEDIRIVSLDAGSQYTKITQSYGNKRMNVAAGIVKRVPVAYIIVAEDNTHLLYVEPMNKANGQIYLGLIFKDGFDENVINSYQRGKTTHRHVLAVKKYEGKPISYYTGFGWSKSNFPNLKSFEDYSTRFVENLKTPLEIEYISK